MTHDHSGFADYGCQACEAAADDQVGAAIELLEEHGYMVLHRAEGTCRELTPQDDIDHEIDEGCPCGPKPLFVDGGVVYIHYRLVDWEATG